MHFKYIKLLIFSLALSMLFTFNTDALDHRIVSDTITTGMLKRDLQNKEQINELNRQIVELTKTIADTKESFYNTNIYLWSFIVGGIGLAVVIGGFFGIQSIRTRIDEIERNANNAINSNTLSVNQYREDLLGRVTEIKTDAKEFRQEQRQQSEKFELRAEKRIEDGLSSEMQAAVDKMMKNIYGQNLQEIQDQVSEIYESLEILKAKQRGGDNDNTTVDLLKKSERNRKDTPNLTSNAFDKFSQPTPTSTPSISQPNINSLTANVNQEEGVSDVNATTSKKQEDKDIKYELDKGLIDPTADSNLQDITDVIGEPKKNAFDKLESDVSIDNNSTPNTKTITPPSDESSK